MRSPLPAVLAIAALLLAGCAPATTPAPSAPATAADAVEPPTSTFDAGYIVSDDSFYDSTAMSEREIQAFFESVSCRADAGVRCLADYRETTETQPAAGPGHCTEYRGAAGERASRIVERVAEACRVSPRTLIVLLQKEQSLLTRPTERGYLRATGYGCPDSADCDEDYFGFFNQVYHAAWQFRQYSEVPERTYRVGTVDVQFHPDPACGTEPVAIRNQATANLYNYTPYQPSPATLEHPDTGDGCSAFGNLNFWRIWHRWFGDPTAERYPGFLPPCTRLIGGDACPETPVTIPSAPADRSAL
ncbi:hypothetical protein [Agromyces aerolatus]|uniref:hypothetical protein n=1 Tax=Agromyces sp. LY-1074 TaxID=3074080 RepID=UPI0028597083|nr:MULTISPECIES: hypothetical protein [unclassified Agromyces]MDR5701319.1 hypothetical protein [Agromyces sp. LY-1074]MDR5707577.1 hypothetical protein [Agromyces sp. LY-1358]